MTLLQQAIATAGAAKAEQRDRLAAEQSARGAKIVAAFKEAFGFDAKYISYGEDVSHKRERGFYGDYRWNKHTDYRYRIIVDGTTLGVKWAADSLPEIEVVYMACARCAHVFPYRLPHISFRYQSTEHGVNRLLTAIGNAALSMPTCSSCEAQPCSECGRAN